MKKYKLINLKNKEEHLCDKVTIDGFEYYANDNNVDLNDWVTNGLQIAQVNVLTVNDPNKHLHKKVIATTNPNIDILKVVDEVEELALKTTLHPKVLFDKLKKCSQNDALLIDEFGDYNIIRYRETTGFILGYSKSQETHPFSEEDMIEFLNWIGKDGYPCIDSTKKGLWVLHPQEPKDFTPKELLQLWKEQQPITLYYES